MTRSGAVLCLLALALPLGCDSTGTTPSGPPQLLRIVVLDLNRFLITDLLDQSPRTSCGAADPCAQGTLECAIDPGADGGVCLDTLDPALTPPPVSTPGGLQIRLVWNQVLDLDGLVAGDADLGPDELAATLVELDGPDGKALPIDARYDPSGSPTPDTIFDVFGPALVLTPDVPLSVATAYTIKLLAPARIHTRAGASYADTRTDAGTSAATTWTFTTEPLYATSPPPGDAPLAPGDALIVTTNAPVSIPGPPSVKLAGAPVLVDAFYNYDATSCQPNPTQIDVIPVAVHGGMPIAWLPGDYTFSFDGYKDADTGKTPLGPDALTSAVFAGTFTIAADADSMSPSAALVLPATCTMPTPASPSDGGMP